MKKSFIVIIIPFLLTCSYKMLKKNSVSKVNISKCELIKLLTDSSNFKRFNKDNYINYYTEYLSQESNIKLHKETSPIGKEYIRIISTKSLYMFDMLLFSNYYNCNCGVEDKVKLGDFNEYEIQLIDFWNKNKSPLSLDTMIIHQNKRN